MKIKVSEKFLALQAEARFTGVPSVFLRTFGCNFRCKNFGRSVVPYNETMNPEVEMVFKNIEKYKKFEDLPLLKTGCDTYSSVYSEFKKFATQSTVEELNQKMIELLPNKKWNKVHLVITGGEPLLGWQKVYSKLLSNSLMRDLTNLTFETNGTQLLTNEFSEYLKIHWRKGWDCLTFSVSPKLSNSGEKWSDAIKPNVIAQYEEHGHTYLKVVVDSEEDLVDVKRAEEEYRAVGFKGDVYLMPCGGTEKLYSQNNTKVALLALKYGYRYSDRLQIPLFKNAWGT